MSPGTDSSLLEKFMGSYAMGLGDGMQEDQVKRRLPCSFFASKIGSCFLKRSGVTPLFAALIANFNASL